MATRSRSNTGNLHTSPDYRQQKDTLSPELFREVVEKVYAMLLKDLKIERERQRTLAHGGAPYLRGGK